MSAHRSHARRIGRLAAVTSVATALLVPLGAASAAAAPAQPLPPGVSRIPSGTPCPDGSLCLYRDYGRGGPSFRARLPLPLDLRRLPMDSDPDTDYNAANNVSHWENRTRSTVVLVDRDAGFGDRYRYLRAGRTLAEPPEFNDTVDAVFFTFF